MQRSIINHWCGHCGQLVPIKPNGKMKEHTCIGCWFASDEQYRYWLWHRR